MTDPQRRFVVTTRSRLHGPHMFPRMFEASQWIQGELDGTPGAGRAVSCVSGSSEFFTVSVWTSRHLMQEFMRSGVHGEIMWKMQQWVASFWQMRWRPTRHEYGSWDGLTLAPSEERRPPREERAPDHVREKVLENIPALREAFDWRGAPSYDAAPDVREKRKLVEGAGGALIRIRTPVYRTPGALRALRALRDRIREQDTELLRTVAGVGRSREVYLLGVWRSRASAARFLDSEWVAELREQWEDGLWAIELLPDNEFGLWDGLRLRDLGEDDRLGPAGAEAGSPAGDIGQDDARSGPAKGWG